MTNAPNPDALRDATNMVNDFPAVEEITGAGFAAIYDALTSSIDIISGILCQPRTCNGNLMTPAGEYLEQIELFLMFERKRIMAAAEAVTDTKRDDGNHARLNTILRFKALEADLSYDEASALIGCYKKFERGEDA
ncbi:hypothetical protein [Rhizobium sp.]|uniref:hypothetical protein n=1 Tax=Rhizobium sp. TaxID=391 RepID=UPI0028AD0785